MATTTRQPVSILLRVLTLACLATPAAGVPADALASPALADFSFGFKGGASLAQHQGIEERDMDYRVSSHWRQGWAASAFLQFPVTQRFGLQQEVGYVQKGSRQDIGVDVLEIPTVLHVAYDMDYVEVSTLFKFAWLQWQRAEIYSLVGTGFGLKVRDHYSLRGEVSDGEQVVPLRADSDMSEVDLFDYSLFYGTGVELPFLGRRVLLEYRFTLGWNMLSMPTYAYVPVGDEWVLVDNPPVPLKNQSHIIQVGIRF
jgi:hypothetical protein